MRPREATPQRLRPSLLDPSRRVSGREVPGARVGMRWDQRRPGGAAGHWATTGLAVLPGDSVIPEGTRVPSIPGAIFHDGTVFPASRALAVKMSCEIQL